MEERDFGTTPILKLFLKCSIPAMVGMAFSTIYYIIDGIFVGRFIGHVALAAVNLVMPLIMIIKALAEMVATGSSVRIYILLGQDNWFPYGASMACGFSIFLSSTSQRSGFLRQLVPGLYRYYYRSTAFQL